MKIILCVGLPASGKSHWAKSQVEKHPEQYKRVNRDDLRLMIDGGKWSRNREKLIKRSEEAIAEVYLSAGFSVIVDDCNLAESTKNRWREFADKMKTTIEFQDFTHVPLETCLERDRKRPNYVGEKAIRQMYRDFLQVKHLTAVAAHNPDLPVALICDIDGTLALLNGRNPYDASLCEQDALNHAISGIVSKYYANGHHVFLVSGRSSKHRAPTERWLQTHNIQHHALYMRQEGDMRKDAIIKREIYEQQIQGKYNVEFVLDDRQQCVDLWRELGLVTLQVAEGDF